MSGRITNFTQRIAGVALFSGLAIFVAGAINAGSTVSPRAVHAADDSDGNALFTNKVKPIFDAQCVRCHNATTAHGGLRIDSREDLLTGGKHGPAIVPGEPENSLLYTAVLQTTDLKMPPHQDQLKPEELQAISDWIKAGAPWPQTN
jgi:mono/diheme cytochrome c family protein